MTKFEYTKLDLAPQNPSTISQLNQHGEAGWELVSVVDVRGMDTKLRYIFKRVCLIK